LLEYSYLPELLVLPPLHPGKELIEPVGGAVEWRGTIRSGETASARRTQSGMYAWPLL